ncbi:MAG TPA: hypothetical protein VKG92_00085 [Flavobacteriales bacterium]|nr:hypothetical protein [Flavobacteriales bacterium]
MRDHHFNASTVVLLSAISGLPEELLIRVRIRARRHNWLHAPWYAASEGGGAMVIGDRIYVAPAHEPDRIANDPGRLLRWTLLMAHEVMHVRQALRFGYNAWGRSRFVTWAFMNYTSSFLHHGRNAHAKAAFEVEAEQGRRRLRALMNATGGCSPQHQLVGLLLNDDPSAMRRWLAIHNVELENAMSADQRTMKRVLQADGPPTSFAE